MSPRSLPGVVLLVLILATAAFAGAPDTALPRHDLEVRLDPTVQTLTGRDRIVLEPPTRPLVFHLAPQAEIRAVEVDGRPARFCFSDGVLEIELPAGLRQGREIEAVIEYAARFADPFPENPVVFDNPGYGVAATMTDQAAFFLSGSGWHPLLAGAEPDAAWRVTVVAPEGISAVTSGRLEGIATSGGTTTSIWSAERARGGLGLVAGPYRVDRETLAGAAREIQILTFLTAEQAALAPTYLAAVRRHLAFYEKLHGPYAFEKFAVAENFFPTGYGFPSYTVLGGRVLALPFIPETSLRHEIAHCWWGNGVEVDLSEGNWCEGLATYVADYLRREAVSPAEAAAARRETLDQFALLAGRDALPLTGFVSRTSPETQAVGYGKAMLVFHMLRRELGDEAFWSALRTLYKDFLFREASWSDLARIFAAAGGWDQARTRRFFDQWLTRRGAPVLGLEQVSAVPDNGRFLVRGVLTQEEPAYALTLPVVVTTAAGNATALIEARGRATPFSLAVPGRPLALAVDPAAEVFRLLDPAEIPATVNSVKGAGTDVTVKLPPVQQTAIFEPRDVQIGNGAVI